jgi:hypothetical protein
MHDHVNMRLAQPTTRQLCQQDQSRQKLGVRPHTLALHTNTASTEWPEIDTILALSGKDLDVNDAAR